MPTSISKATRLWVAIVSLLFTALIYWGFQLQEGNVTLATVVAKAIPYEQALQNHKPTLIEFYADWCESCQSMAKDNYALEQKYGDRVNFVLLNVDNNKWLPELTKYRVDGIPRWIWLDANHNQIGDGAGVIPKPIMEFNLIAMINGEPLPHNGVIGSTSEVSSPKVDDTQPRSHS
jgi:thiol:disulfide interchange protein